MALYPLGTPFHGEFSSADASALTEVNSRFALYGNPKAGADAALVLTTNDYVYVTDVILVAGVALRVQLYDGANNVVDAGEVILEGNFPANGGVSLPAGVGHYCQQSTYPKVKTGGAGQIDCIIRGFIWTHPGT